MPLLSDRSPRLSSWVVWLRGALDSPFMDLLPWLLMSWIGGSGRVSMGACVGLLLLALAVFLRGVPWRLLQLEVLATCTFVLLLLMALFAPAGAQGWLAEHADQLSDSLFMAFVLGGNLLGRPFTEGYARMELPEHLLRQPPYRQTIMVLAWVWFAALLQKSWALWLIWSFISLMGLVMAAALGVIMAALTFTEGYCFETSAEPLSWQARLVWSGLRSSVAALS